MSSEKPILFSTPMVQAILAGNKSMTRRVIKKKYENTHIEWFKNKYGTRLVEMQNNIEGETFGVNPDGTSYQKILSLREIKCPWEVGQTLWVRETWADTWTPDSDELGVVYKADGVPARFPYWGSSKNFKDEVWRPSIFMPRSAARLFLKVTNIRVEKLQDITEDDARREGCIDFHDKIGDGKFDDVAEFDLTARDAFAELWDGLNSKRGYGWSLNPWVWVIEFERVEDNEGD